MNTENYTPFTIPFEEIFQKQREIKMLYEPSAQDIFEHFDINTFEDQETFKKYCWRITEELMEALEDPGNLQHFKEEIIDGFNFMVELYLLCGLSYGDMPKKPISILKGNPIEFQIQKVVLQLGLTANLLKNRQWRRSQYMVDLYIFKPRLMKIWALYMGVFELMDMSHEEIQGLWSLKYQVNKFRIESNY